MFLSCLTLAAILGSAAAFAAPVPKSPPPPAPKTNASLQLGTAKMNGEMIQFSYTVDQTVAMTVSRLEAIKGENITVTAVEYQTKTVPVSMNLNAKAIKATTADGKELSEEDLAKKLTDGAAVVRVYTAFDPEWKRLFADDVIFLDATANVRPGGVIRPGVVRPLPAPLPPGLPPIIEKAVEVAPAPIIK